MQPTYCVFNKTTESFLGLNITRIPGTVTGLSAIFKEFHMALGEGLWIVPSRGIHTFGRVAPVDVIYLDASNRVIHLIEHMRPFRFAPPRTGCTSMLEMPPHTIYASGTHLGDQIMIGIPEELVSRIGDPDVSSAGVPLRIDRSDAAPAVPAVWNRSFALFRKSAFSPAIRACEGQALIEAAVTLPILLLLMANALNFGLYIYACVTVSNAARAVTEYRAYNGVVVGLPPSPSLSQMQCLLYREVSTLPNRGAGNDATCSWSNVKFRVCSKQPAHTAVCVGDTSSALLTFSLSDDPGGYTIYSAEVSYAYAPLFTSSTLPLTLLPTNVNRHVVMRSMN